MQSARIETVFDVDRDEFRGGSVHVIVTVAEGSIMAAVHTTRAGAMAAAVGWVEGEAETRLSGSLEECYERARWHVKEQGGQMEIVGSPIFGPV